MLFGRLKFGEGGQSIEKGSGKKSTCKSEFSTGVKPRHSGGGLKHVDGVEGASILINGEPARLDCEG